MSVGIDYGMGKTNIDTETGIRYGIINQNHVSGDALNDLESNYGDPHCPRCGEEAKIIPCHSEPHAHGGITVIQDMPEAYENYEMARGACGDIACESCEYLFDGDEAFSDEPLSHFLDDGEYKVEMGTEGFGVWVMKSPYYTFARFCSPCAPGAGDLDAYDEDGVKTYCLGAEWFDEYNPCPYPIWSVETGILVQERRT